MVELNRVISILVYIYTIVVGFCKYLDLPFTREISWHWVFIPIWVVIIGPFAIKLLFAYSAGRINKRKNF